MDSDAGAMRPRTVPVAIAPGVAQGQVVVEGAPRQVVELRFGFSLRGADQARENLYADCGPGPSSFEQRRAATAATWEEHLGAITVDSPSAERRSVLATAVHHSLIKPCLALGESPFWPTSGAFACDIATMWDIYGTQLPLLTALRPGRAVELAQALLHISEGEGNLPIGCRMARGADQFSRQASALAHTFLADLCQLGLGLDWDWALVHLHNDLRRTYGEDFLLRGEVHPISHTLDLAFGHWCTSKTADHVGDAALVAAFARSPPAGPTRSTPRPGYSRTRPSTRAAGGTTRSGWSTTWRPGSPSPVGTGSRWWRRCCPAEVR